ncbi:hypothetical protein BH11PLA1_BH11PLA1_03020 [soil metagenome]
MPPRDTAAESRDVLTLTMISGLGPVLIARLLAAFESPASIFTQSAQALASVRGISLSRARAILDQRAAAESLARDEAVRAADLGVVIIGRSDPAYPPLLLTISDAPPILYLRGLIDHAGTDQYPLALVGSRDCTHYGMEQTERFAGALASSGITIVSGGARGIDTAAHRAALRLGGRTIAVLGCGLQRAYPEENARLFDEIAQGRGAVISELPMTTPPSAENFPARNRIISGLSLGVLVVEAGNRSGSLITARLAAEDHGREVFALPGRVDSAASEGTLQLIKIGGATLVTAPGDILEALHAPARHLHGGTHAARYPARQDDGEDRAAAAQDERAEPAPRLFGAPRPGAPAGTPLTPSQRQLIDLLKDPLPIDDLLRLSAQEIGPLRADLTLLELRRLVTRRGSAFVAAKLKSE